MFKQFSFSALFLSPAALALADHGKGAVGGKTISPRTLHEEDFSLDMGFRYQKSETFSDQRLLEADANGHDLHSVEWLAEFSTSIAYGVTDHLTMSLSLPMEIVHGFRFVDTGVIDEANAITGLGDATPMGKYSLLADPVELAVITGIKIPTGSTNQLANSGSLLEPDHQPGTGSWASESSRGSMDRLNSPSSSPPRTRKVPRRTRTRGARLSGSASACGSGPTST